MTKLRVREFLTRLRRYQTAVRLFLQKLVCFLSISFYYAGFLRISQGKIFFRFDTRYPLRSLAGADAGDPFGLDISDTPMASAFGVVPNRRKSCFENLTNQNVGASIARPALECYECADSTGKLATNSAGRPMAAPT